MVRLCGNRRVGISALSVSVRFSREATDGAAATDCWPTGHKPGELWNATTLHQSASRRDARDIDRGRLARATASNTRMTAAHSSPRPHHGVTSPVAAAQMTVSMRNARYLRNHKRLVNASSSRTQFSTGHFGLCKLLLRHLQTQLMQLRVHLPGVKRVDGVPRHLLDLLRLDSAPMLVHSLPLESRQASDV